MSVEIANETQWVIDPKEFSDLGLCVLRQMRVSPDADLSVTFINPEPMASLHEEWMGLLGPTDVMSFPMDELRPGPEVDNYSNTYAGSYRTYGAPARQEFSQALPEGILGDIVICPDVAARQAQVAHHTIVEEMMLLETHGILHLLGFDHINPQEEHTMFALQRQLLLVYLAQRTGELRDIFLPAEAPDLLAEYESRLYGAQSTGDNYHNMYEGSSGHYYDTDHYENRSSHNDSSAGISQETAMSANRNSFINPSFADGGDVLSNDASDNTMPSNKAINNTFTKDKMVDKRNGIQQSPMSGENYNDSYDDNYRN